MNSITRLQNLEAEIADKLYEFDYVHGESQWSDNTTDKAVIDTLKSIESMVQKAIKDCGE